MSLIESLRTKFEALMPYMDEKLRHRAKITYSSRIRNEKMESELAGL